jgi:hypothetical protein
MAKPGAQKPTGDTVDKALYDSLMADFTTLEKDLEEAQAKIS